MLFVTTGVCQRNKRGFFTVNRWESGKTKPNMAAMKSIKEFCFKYDVDYAPLEELWLDLGTEDKQHD